MGWAPKLAIPFSPAVPSDRVTHTAYTPSAGHTFVGSASDTLAVGNPSRRPNWRPFSTVPHIT